MKDKEGRRRSRARITLADMFSPRIVCRTLLRIGKPGLAERSLDCVTGCGADVADLWEFLKL